jgi:hypothetical protein
LAKKKYLAGTKARSDHEDRKDGYDTMSSPIKDWDKIVASRLAADNISLRVHSTITNSQLFVKGTNEEHLENRYISKIQQGTKQKDEQVIIST